MFEQHTSWYIKPNLDLPNYKWSAFYQRISQLHRKYDPNKQSISRWVAREKLNNFSGTTFNNKLGNSSSFIKINFIP